MRRFRHHIGSDDVASVTGEYLSTYEPGHGRPKRDCSRRCPQNVDHALAGGVRSLRGVAEESLRRSRLDAVAAGGRDLRAIAPPIPPD